MKTDAEIAILVQEAMASSPGISELVVDGIRIKVDEGSLDYWERRAARNAVPVTLPVSASIDLS